VIIDYGHVRSGFGETLQALQAHAFADPLAAPGEADLTAHVDFAAFAGAARRGGAAVHGPVPQGPFLHSLGIAGRAERLAAADGTRAEVIGSQLLRLTEMTPTGMGQLFKVLALTPPAVDMLPGFGSRADESSSAEMSGSYTTGHHV
jgi:NADH dehydrogenase [ubiquinone] 1 alpha subcomplex assembly factor 7